MSDVDRIKEAYDRCGKMAIAAMIFAYIFGLTTGFHVGYFFEMKHRAENNARAEVRK